jgi:replicative DNA helicase
MDREAARQEVKKRFKCEDYLEKSKSGLYCCPFCNSGYGPNATGALKVYSTNTWTCHSCDKSGDVIDLYQQANNTDFNSALSLMAQEIGINIETYSPDFYDKSDRAGRPQTAFNEAGNSKPVQGGRTRLNGNSEPVNYTAYYQDCRKRLSDPAALEYLNKRGISEATAAAYWIGYDPEADPAKTNHPCPRLIVPTSESHYVARRIDGGKDFAKMNPKGSSPAVFNLRALYAQDVQEVFITEGAFDALSIIEAGASAIALNSAENAQKLIDQLERRTTKATLIIALDNDAKGKSRTDTLRDGLQRLNISYVVADVSAGHKDPNEALTADKEAFKEAIERAKHQAAAKPDNTAFYIDKLMSGDIERFKDDKKTGFKNLDRESGGLYGGLYALAAISSLGKTSFALQLADQLAMNGHDVIFFSLEQSRLELVSKSLARRTAKKDREKAVTSLSIRKGYLPRQVLEAAEDYKKDVADRVSIVEGNFNCNISFIGEYVRQYVRRNGTRPVVFIDYLQILQPAEDERRPNAKETIDNTVTELKRLSRELDLTVFIISSVNRANYLTPIDFESLKESGSIEFTCDVVWGLQFQCLADPLFSSPTKIKEKRERIKQAKRENPRKIELSCLKNRYGIANYSCYFDYYPANDLFEEADHAALDFVSFDTSTSI